MADEKAQLGEKIRAARAEKGWKQKHLAAEVDVEPITVSRWERGATRPDLNVLHQLAEATGKPVSYFVGGEEAEASGSATSLDDAARRIEAAALHIAAETDRLADLLGELRSELGRSR
jgi:transcriptional regulator with XRE-family HTH domain